MAIAAKILAIGLGLGGAVTMLVAIGALLGAAPEAGAGVILVDSFFGTIVLFAAARLLWLYAPKKKDQ